MKFALHSHDKIDQLSLRRSRTRGFRARSKTKMARVSCEMLLCLKMAISATLTNNSTIGLLLWAKQKRRSRFLALSSNCGLPNINILAKRRFQRRTRRSHLIRPGRTDLWWRNMIEDRCLPEEWRKNFRMSKENFMGLKQKLSVDGYILGRRNTTQRTFPRN